MFCRCILLIFLVSFVVGNYQPTWKSLDKRPLPKWYDEAKIGIFLHWGVFSVPSFGSEWFWADWQLSKSPDFVKFMEQNYKPGFTYPEFARQFTAEFYDPDQWAEIFAASGAKPVAEMFVCCILLMASVSYVAGNYTPTWDSLDKRPLPKWYDKAKIGIFLHWGVYSVPSSDTEWFWKGWRNSQPNIVNYIKQNYKPGFTYAGFASKFTAEFYDPYHWAEIFAASGAKYVVLTSKHHEGYTLWPSKVSWNWNAKDIGSGRDLLGDLATAIRNKTDLHFGVYHSMFEWFHPLYLKDKENQFKTRYFVETKTMPELIELVTEYEPEIIWSDGDWEAPDTYWKAQEFLAWLYNKSPVKDVVVVNDRWGSGIPCHHGGYYTCTDKFNPKTLQLHKWENAMTVDKNSWGFRRNAQLSDYLSIEELITTLAETVSCGGNLLINVGPSHDGLITPLFEERLRQLGAWLKINGEAIYESQPWTYQNDTITPGVWYTTNGDYVYTIVLDWPENSILKLGALQPPEGSEIFMLGVSAPLSWKTTKKQTFVNFPFLTPNTITRWAWVLKSSKISD